jgi:glycosyltransferase involved in cell wall biosynthesis
MEIGLVHPNLNLRGGGEYVGLEFLNALQDEHDVTLVTLESPDLEKLNEFFGCEVENNFDIIEASFPVSLFRKTDDSFNKLRNSLLKHYAGFHEDKFDLMICTHNEAAFSNEGIQYIHFPETVNEDVFLEEGEVSFDLERGRSPVHRVYLKFVNQYLPEKGKVSQNRTLCNSSYTKEVFEEAYSSEADVLNPPVSMEFEDRKPFDDREDAFICVGRIAPPKDQKGLIRVFDEINREMDLPLYIVGEGSSDYADEVREMAHEREYVIFEGRLSREGLKEKICSVKYGIHNLRGEHYGLAPAEMVKGGCIVFVREKGGQTDIVGNNEQLIFENEEDAVGKIKKIIEDRVLREEILEDLGGNELNSPEDFRTEVKKVIENFED